MLLSCCVLCWDQLPPRALGSRMEEVWEGEQSWSLEQALVSPGPYWVRMSQVEQSIMPSPSSWGIRGLCQPQRTGETPLVELPSPSLAGSAH